METTRDEIRTWLERGKADGAAFMIVAMDTFDGETYPVYVTNVDVKKEVERLNHEPNTRVKEVYSYGLSLEEQLLAGRAWFVE
jgi:hypothetical protein